MKNLLFLLEFLSYLFVFLNFFHFSFTKSKIRHLATAIVLVFWNIILFFNNPLIPGTIIILFLMLLLFSEQWYILLTLGLAYTLTLSMCCNVLFYLIAFLTDNNIYSQNTSELTDSIVLFAVVLFSFYFRNRNITNHLVSMEKQDYILLFVVILADFFLSSISTVVFTIDINIIGRHVVVLAMLFLILMSIVLLALYFRIKNYQHTLLQMNEQNQKLLGMEVQHYKELQQKNIDLRAFRHDFQYHVTAMQGLVDAKDWRGLTDYIENLSLVREQTYSISTNHPVADAVVNYFYERMPASVSFHVQGKFPEQISVTDTDLCIILSNLLKNAEEAMETIPSCEDRKIYLSIFFTDTNLIIRVENTSKEYSNEELENLTTSKLDTHNHGFGLKNIAEVVQRNYGQLDLQYRDGMFCVGIVLTWGN